MIIFIANQFIGQGVSTGGDVLFSEIAKRVTQKKKILIPIGPLEKVKEVFEENEIIITDKNNGLQTSSTILGGFGTVLHYFARALSSSCWLAQNATNGDTLYLTGDFICNSIPAVVCKLFHDKITIVANFYHRNPPPQERSGNLRLISFFSRLLQGISLRLIKSVAKITFVLSDVGLGELIREGFSRSSIVVSGAGVNKIPRPKAVSNRKDQIVFIGRINVTKGAFDLMEIFHNIVEKSPKFRLIMIGGTSTEDNNKLKKLITQYYLADKVSYLGYVDEKVKYKIISQSKALVLPSKEEGFGIVIMEALACRTPVVCYDLPALKAIYAKYKSVYFVNRFSKTGFTDKVIEVISNKQSLRYGKVLTWDNVYSIQSKYL